AASGPAAALRTPAVSLGDARQARDARRIPDRPVRGGGPQPRRARAAAAPGRARRLADVAIERFPGLRRQGLTGAAVFYDYVTTESDRLTFSFALAAAEHGATLANHVEAIEPILDTASGRRRVAGVRARDGITGRTLDVGARP